MPQNYKTSSSSLEEACKGNPSLKYVLQDILSWQSSFVDVSGIDPHPPAGVKGLNSLQPIQSIQSLDVTGVNGVYKIQITPLPLTTGVTYYTLQSSQTVPFETSTTLVTYGPSPQTFYSITQPNRTLYWRVCSKTTNSQNSSWFYSSGSIKSGPQDQVFDVTDFGAIGDWFGSSGTDNLPAFTRAYNAAVANNGGIVLIPPALGGYWLNGIWDTSNGKAITIRGFAQSFDDDGSTSHQPSTIVFNNASHYWKITKGRYFNLENIAVDCNNVASANGIVVDRLLQSAWNQVSVVKCPSGTGLKLYDTTGSDIVGYCSFNDLNFEVVGVGIELNGVIDVSGVFHCFFSNSRIGFNIKGIRLIQTDNVTFINTYIDRESGSGKGVTWEDPSVSHPPNSIYFNHLEASQGGISWDASVTAPGPIFGYDMSNGQPFPTGYPSSITTDGLANVGWYTTCLFPGTMVSSTQHAVALTCGTGVPNNADGQNGWFYFRSDGGSLTSVYQKRAGVWVGLV